MRQKRWTGGLALFAALAATTALARPEPSTDPDSPARRTEVREAAAALDHPATSERLRAVKRIAASLDSAPDPAPGIATLEAAAAGSDPAAEQARAALERWRSRQTAGGPVEPSRAEGHRQARQGELLAESADLLGGPASDRLLAVETLAANLDATAEREPVLVLLRSAAADRDRRVALQAAHALARHADRYAESPLPRAAPRADPARIDGEPELVRELAAALESSERSDRLSAVKRLAQLVEGARDREAVVRMLAAAAGDSDRGVAAQASHALERSRGRELID